jgi:ubiquinone/menaquinone biosynthesis C-methylase UbiE
MFSDPVQNLKTLGLRETDIVADLGAGTGFYAVAAGQMVPHGKVYAVEVQKDFLLTIKQKTKEACLNNVECLWGDIEKIGGSKIEDGIADAVVASNVLFQVEDKEGFIKEANRILKKGGKVLLVDWSDPVFLGPLAAKLIVPQEKARAMFEQAGFTFQNDINAGLHHYGMILKKL